MILLVSAPSRYLGTSGFSATALSFSKRCCAASFGRLQNGMAQRSIFICCQLDYVV